MGFLGIIAMVGLFVLFLNLSDGNVFISLLFPALVGAGLIYSKNSKVVTGPKPQEFDANFSHNNIAINTESGKIWLRDVSGKTAIFDKADISRWRHEHASLGLKNYDNRLIVDVRDLSSPVWTVRFSRHNDNFDKGAKQNFEDARDWHSRLTAWLL